MQARDAGAAAGSSAAAAGALEAGPVIWLRYLEGGVATSISLEGLRTVDDLTRKAVLELPDLHGRHHTHVAARKATVDEDDKVISIESRVLPASGKLQALKISGDSHIVFELRAPAAAATGGTAASGEWRTPRACAVAQRLGCVRVAHLTLRRPSAAVCVCRPGGGSDRRRGHQQR
jgi:hypothetical protein